jgi:hypothetical protein
VPVEFNQHRKVDLASKRSFDGIEIRSRLPMGAFLDKSIPEAIKLLYAATTRKCSPTDVATTLKK